MPINAEHAFGNGISLEKPTAYQKRLWSVLSIVHSAYRTKAQIATAWQQFKQQANISPACLLGPQAWCVNMQADPQRICLEGRVICRGLLRIEAYGDGKILLHPEVYLGDDCLISCSNGVEIGNHTLIAHGVQIFDNDTHPLDWQSRLNDWKSIACGEKHLKPEIPSDPITIGQYVWIGCNSLIMKGVTIGDRSVVAAGSVVTKSIPADVVVGGNPARILTELASSPQALI
ncbi:hypothetical protein C7271_03055 [filamentous cyanobacterium CCP5]|nr:hypothetical protein C7271_03055 [filamentous cyanobacterium CCP5]